MQAYLISVRKVGLVDLVFQTVRADHTHTADAVELETQWSTERAYGAHQIQEQVATDFLMNKGFFLMDIQMSDRTRVEVWSK